MKPKYCDLHCHTLISDGAYSPEELIQRAMKLGLTTLCITDHNAVNPDLPRLRAKYPQIELPSGCEFSCSYMVGDKQIQLHVGGIGFDQNDEKVIQVIRHNQASMEGYINMTLYKLKTNCNIDLCTYEDLLSKNPYSQTMGRKAVASEMVYQGICKTIEECFDKFLGNRNGIERPAYVSNAKNFVTLEEVISAVTAAGGVVSLCHLFEYVNNYNLTEQNIHRLLDDFKYLSGNRGAMEVLYASYSKEQQAQLKSYADQHKLLYSAASDYHDGIKAKELGLFPQSIYDEMRKAMKS